MSAAGTFATVVTGAAAEPVSRAGFKCINLHHGPPNRYTGLPCTVHGMKKKKVANKIDRPQVRNVRISTHVSDVKRCNPCLKGCALYTLNLFLQDKPLSDFDRESV